MKRYDAFICHASEDKETIVREIARLLTKAGYRIWYDEFSLTVGDGLRRSIDKGILESRFGIVIFSRHFFEKEWTNYELDGLTSFDLKSPGIILPIWHGVTKQEVMSYSPSLANIYALQTNGTEIAKIAEILEGKLGIHRYYANASGKITKSKQKYPISPDSREQGFQSVYSNQVDRLLNKTEAHAISEIVVNPLSLDLSEYPLHYWQNDKGNIKVVRHAVYEVPSGNVLSSKNVILENDGNRLLALVKFNLEVIEPIKIVGVIVATNRFKDLFTEKGFDYQEFTVKRSTNFFSYTLVVPETKDFAEIEMYANGEKVKPRSEGGEILHTHQIKNLARGNNLNYTIINRAIKKS